MNPARTFGSGFSADVSSGRQRLPEWNQNAAGISAFYFKDPDEHPVEILQFPAD